MTTFVISMVLLTLKDPRPPMKLSQNQKPDYRTRRPTEKECSVTGG